MHTNSIDNKRINFKNIEVSEANGYKYSPLTVPESTERGGFVENFAGNFENICKNLVMEANFDFEMKCDRYSTKIESYASFSSKIEQLLKKLNISERNSKIAEIAYCLVQDLEVKMRTSQHQKVDYL